MVSRCAVTSLQCAKWLGAGAGQLLRAVSVAGDSMCETYSASGLGPRSQIGLCTCQTGPQHTCNLRQLYIAFRLSEGARGPALCSSGSLASQHLLIALASGDWCRVREL